MAEKDFVVKNGLVVNTNLIVADGDLNRVGINNSAPDASLTVTGTANVSGNAVFGSNLTTIGVITSNSLIVTGNVTLNNFAITTSPNVVSINTSNVNIDSGVLFVDSINNRVGINNTTPDAQLTITGSANVSGNLTVLGNFVISGNIVSSGTQEFTGNLTPQTTGISLGNTSNFWDLYARNAEFSANAKFGANLLINSTAIVWTGNSTTSPTINLSNTGSLTIGNSTSTQTASVIRIANSSGNSSITPAGFSGNGFNLTINAANVTFGTLPNDRLSSAVVNTSGNFTLAGNNTLSGSNTTITSNLNVTGTFLNVAAAFVVNSLGAFHTGTINAASHTVGSNLVVNSTSVSYIGNSTTSPTVSLANTGAFIIGNSTTTQTTSVISVANSTGSANITPAGFFGNGFNITSLNATSITNGTIPELRLPLGNATNRGALLVLDSVTNTYITDYAASANSVKTAYDVAIAANTRAASAQTAAASAFTNATTFAANATNITSGTIASARISGAYTGITQVGTLVGLVATGNINFDSGLLFVDGTNNKVGVNTTAPSVSLQIAANDAIFVPLGNTAQRPTGANGMFRFNTDTSTFEGYSNSAWGTIAGSGAGGYYKGNLGAQGNTDNKANLYRINSNTQSNNITISAGENALTVGPMVIQDGINLTIEEGGRAVII